MAAGPCDPTSMLNKLMVLGFDYESILLDRKPLQSVRCPMAYLAEQKGMLKLVLQNRDICLQFPERYRSPFERRQ